MEFVGTAIPLNTNDIALEAQRLGTDQAAIWAVCDVESSGSGFLPDNRPKILFEAHAFHTLTHGLYDHSAPNISSPYWNQSLYGASGAHQYDRLAKALLLNRQAALESASWGRFQIMGSNHLLCGYSNVEDFVSDMLTAETNHLAAFGNFCTNTGITAYLINHDWSHFALRYNGPGNVADYARKLRSAYNRHLATNPTPTPLPQPTTLAYGDRGVAVVALQQKLIQLGYPIRADGDFGAQTANAVKLFQNQNGLVADGIVGPNTLLALDAI